MSPSILSNLAASAVTPGGVVQKEMPSSTEASFLLMLSFESPQRV
jgi:hypothetical protein